MRRLSVLDLVTYPEGGSIPEALAASTQLAQLVERRGYRRYWVAEHHNLDGIASSATVVIMAHVAANTRSIRIGSGGIMLPNHAPYVVAEQIATLESLHPGRIDLGLGRAPGTDPLTMRALRRHSGGRGEDFDVQVAELLSYLDEAEPGQAVKAIPGAGVRVPVWILGSSLYSAHFAAAIGRPYAFAAHFAPADLMEALATYRREFKPSAHLDRPYAMVGVPIFAAETDEKAEFLATSMYQRTLGIIRGRRTALQPPVRDMDAEWSPAERFAVADRMALMVVGGPERIVAGLEGIVEATGADELILVSDAYEARDRRRSFEIVAEAMGLAPADAATRSA